MPEKILLASETDKINYYVLFNVFITKLDRSIA